MNKKIYFVSRRRLPEHHSIEEIFKTLRIEISKFHEIYWLELKESGGSPFVLLKNLIAIKPKKNCIYHITGDIHYIAIRLGRDTVLTIHDVYSIIRGNFFKKIYLKIFWFWIPSLVVKKITVISEFSKKELSNIIPFAKHKISVIPNPVSPNFCYDEYTFKENKPHILCIGTKKNKNLIRTFEALKDINCKLFIVGELKKPQTKLLNEYAIEYSNHFNLSDQEMIEAFKNCDLLCFASTYEGFGMPIIEAQATGRPVITSNLGAMKEVASNAACLVDPYSVGSIKKGLKKVINDKTYRETLIKSGLVNSKKYRSKKIAIQYKELYTNLSENN